METQHERVMKILADVKAGWDKKTPKTVWKKVKRGVFVEKKPPQKIQIIPPKILEVLVEDKEQCITYVKNKYKRCQNTECNRLDDLTIDHIIPVSWLKNLGFLSIETMTMRQRKNLTILCRACNNRKGSKMDLQDKKIRRLMLWYIKNYDKIKWKELG